MQIDSTNHPMGPLGAMMMGDEQADRVEKAMTAYNGQNGIIEIDADMELVMNLGGEKLVFINSSFECG